MALKNRRPIKFPRVEKIIRQRGSDGVAIARMVLKREKKIATAFTANSIEFDYQFIQEENAFLLQLEWYAADSMFQIQKGRKKDEKMPPSIFSRSGLRLNLWMGSKNMARNSSSDWGIRNAIKEKGIPAVPVIDMAFEEIAQIMIDNELIRAFKEDILEHSYSLFQDIMDGKI